MNLCPQQLPDISVLIQTSKASQDMLVLLKSFSIQNSLTSLIILHQRIFTYVLLQFNVYDKFNICGKSLLPLLMGFLCKPMQSGNKLSRYHGTGWGTSLLPGHGTADTLPIYCEKRHQLQVCIDFALNRKIKWSQCRKYIL